MNLVADTSVLIDLDRGALLEATFRGPHSLLVPDYLFQKELASGNGDFLRRIGLTVVSLTPEETSFAQERFKGQTDLSLPDCFALSMSRRNEHVLLAGDRRLRTAAEGVAVVTRGLLWLLDELVTNRPTVQTEVAAGLGVIANHPRCRLPRDEVQQRLRRWEG